MSKWYEIKARANYGEISIYDEIGAWGVSAKSFMDELKSLDKVSDITLRINSPGGSVFDGMAIYNRLKNHKAQITVHIDGLAASMASVIAMAGDLIVMPKNSMMMIHNPWSIAIGDADQMREDAGVLDKIKSAMITTYASKTGKSEQEISDMMDAETWMNGEEALEMGFADESTEAIDIAASIRGFDLSKFQNSPIKEKPVQKLILELDTTEAEAMLSRMRAEIENSDFTLSAVADNKPTKEESFMTTENKATSPVDTQAAIDDAVKGAMAKEETRKADIVAAFGDFSEKHGELLNKCLLDSKVSADDARTKLLKALGEGEKPFSGSVEAGKSGADRFIEDGVEALMARAGKGQISASNPLRGYRLDQLARKSLEVAGIRADGMDSRSIVGSAFTQTSSDFPVLLENTMHKVLQSAYATQEDTWSRFCSTGSVSDFRAHNRYRLGSFGNLDSLNEAGEFKNKSIPDGEKSQITAGTKGNVINITRQAIINDDLDAFMSLAAMLGRSARRTIESDVYALLGENSGLGPTMADGNTLFHASHNNIGTGSAISAAGIEADRVLMGSQMDVSGNDYLDLRPQSLLIPLSLGGTARVINDAQYDPDTANKLQKPNMVRGLFSDIIDTPRLTGTRRYLFADPNLAPVIEVAFLNGDQNPFLEAQEGFTVDGMKWKVRMDYGVAAIDYRGGVTNAGA